MAEEREHVGVGEPTMYNCLQCSSKFNQKFNLTRHIKSDHTSDEFKCDQFTSSFGRKGVLARHKRMKHTIRKCDKHTIHTLRKCEECDFVTCERWEAEYHFLTMHPPDM